MFINKFPYFKKGSILKREMLESLRDYPREYLDLFYKDYSDGIITGCEIIVDESHLFIKEGILKHNGFLYTLTENQKIRYDNSNKEIIIKIAFKEMKRKEFKESHGSIFLDQDLTLKETEVELGRFKLREGAKLRSARNDFFDFDTEYNMVNIINVNYSTKQEKTINPLLVKCFAKQAFKQDLSDSYDISFLMNCMNSNLLSRDLLSTYLIKKLKIEEKYYTNLEMYKYMSRVLKDLGRAKGNQEEEKNRNKNRRPNRIIVD